MTLLKRLSVVMLIFGLLGFISYKILYPKPTFVGEYAAESKRGSYILKLLSAERAVMIVTDKKGTRYAYQGVLYGEGTKEGIKLTIDLNHQRVGEEWEPLAKTVHDVMLFKEPGTITAPEGVFTRSSK